MGYKISDNDICEFRVRTFFDASHYIIELIRIINQEGLDAQRIKIHYNDEGIHVIPGHMLPEHPNICKFEYPVIISDNQKEMPLIIHGEIWGSSCKFRNIKIINA